MWQAGDLKRSRLKTGGGSYLSSHDPREVLGIGPRTKIDRLEVHWPQPSGKVEVFTELPVDRYITIVEGEGVVRGPWSVVGQDRMGQGCDQRSRRAEGKNVERGAWRVERKAPGMHG